MQRPTFRTVSDNNNLQTQASELPIDVWKTIFECDFEDDDITLWRLYKTCKKFKELAWIYLKKRSNKLQEAARTFLQNKKPSLAYQILCRALVFTPKNSSIYFARASCMQNFDGARWDCLKGIELEPYSYKGDDTKVPNLFEAIKYRSLRQMEGILSKGVAVNEVSPDSGFTPLALACQLNFLEFVECLLQRGAIIYESEPVIKLNAILTLLDVYTHKKKQQEDSQHLQKQSLIDKRGINEYDLMRQKGNVPRGVEGSNSDSSAHDEVNNVINNTCRILLREWTNELIVKELLNSITDKQFMQNNLWMFHKGIATGNVHIVNMQIKSLQHGLQPSHKAKFVKEVLLMKNQEGSAPLHEAIATNDSTLVQLILDTIVFAANSEYSVQSNMSASEYTQAVLSITNNRSLTPFLFACTVPKIKLDIINLLLNFQCNIATCDPQNRKCFVLASLSENYHILETLTNCDKHNVLNLQSEELSKIVDSDGNTLLHHTLALGFNKLNLLLLSILKKSIDAHTTMNADGMTPLMTAVSNMKSSNAVLQELIHSGSNLEFQNHEGNTVLHIATLHFNFAAASMLIKNGADMDTQNRCGTTALCLACSGAVNESVAWLLLSSGAHMIPNFRGITPLMMACEYGLKGLIDILLQYGADVNAQDSNGYTALHRAIESGHHQVIPALAKAAANLNTADKRGYTPLHLAIYWGHEMCSRFLIELGCDLHAKTAEGQDIVQFAVEKSGNCRSGSYILAMIIEALGVVDAKCGDVSIIPVRDLNYVAKNIREFLVIVKGNNDLELILSKKIIVTEDIVPKRQPKYDEELLEVLGQKFLNQRRAMTIHIRKNQEWNIVTPSQFWYIQRKLQKQAMVRGVNLLQVVELWRHDEVLRDYLMLRIGGNLWEDPE